MKTIFSYQPVGTNLTSKAMFYTGISDVRLPNDTQKFKRALFIYDGSLEYPLVKQILALFAVKISHITTYKFIYGHKSVDNLEPMWQAMVKCVPDVVIGMGGGTTTDLVGFASATYQRGIPDILVPTTVLSMIDASLGGKTAIDFGGLKNSVGAMHYPIFAINIISLLKTLPKPEFFSGFGEAVKAAVLFDKTFFGQLENYAGSKDFSVQNQQLFDIMSHSASLKMKNSEMPANHKIKLLYGHAVGHALELMGDERVRHGDAVAIGMTIEGALACLLKIWNQKEWLRQTELLKSLHLPILPKSISRNFIDDLAAKMSLYKKLVLLNSFGFILPEKIGKVAETNGQFLTFVSAKNLKILLAKSLKFIEDNHKSVFA